MATTDATITYSETQFGRVAKGVVTPVIDTSIYASGDSLHTNDLLFAGMAQVNGGSGVITKLVIADDDIESAAGEAWIFTAAVSATHTLNTAWNAADADLQACVGVIPFGPYSASSAASVSTNGSVRLPYQCAAATTSLWVVLVTRATPTYTAATDLHVTITAELD